MKLRIHDQILDVRPGPASITLDGEAVPFELVRRIRRGESWELLVRLGDRPHRWFATPMPDGTLAVTAPGGAIALAAPAREGAAASGPYGPVVTPLAGVVTSLLVTPGQAVAQGEPLAVIEAMKIRYTLEAEAAGTVTEVLIVEQALVTARQVLLHLAP